MVPRKDTSQRGLRKEAAKIWLKRTWRAALAGTLHFGLWWYDRLFDWVLTYIAIDQLGLAMGTAVMMVASFLSCLFFIRIHDKISEASWMREPLGFDVLREGGLKIQTSLKTKWPFRIFKLREGGPTFNILIFLGITAFFEPMSTMLYFRKGGQTGMTRNDWYVFLGSVALSNLLWCLFIWTGIEFGLPALSTVLTFFEEHADTFQQMWDLVLSAPKSAVEHLVRSLLT